MGTTSEKLTYLNNTKQLLKENINNLGGNLTAEPFRQYASVLEGIYERIPKVSGIGSNLSLSPTMVGRIKLNEIQGNTLQDNTPTPSSPVPIQSVTGLQNVNVCGKNLLPFTNQDYTLKGIRFYVENGNLYLNGTSTGEISGSSAEHKQNFSFYLEAGTYHFERGSSVPTYIKKYSDNSNLATNSGTFTLEKKTQVFLGIYIYQMSFDNQLLLCQLEQGSTATEYEPYNGNTYEVNLGKNLFDKDTSSNAQYVLQPDGSIIINSSWGNDGRKYFNEIELQAGTYTLSYIPNLSGTNKTERFSIFNITSNTDIVNTSFAITNDTKINYTFTLSENSTIKICIMPNQENGGAMTINEIQLEKGSQATSYSPYFTPIELNKTNDNVYQDSIKKSSGKNLFDKSTITSGYINTDGSITSSQSYVTSDYIPIDSSLTYSKTATNSPRIKLYDKDKNLITTESYSDISGFGNAGTYTIPYTNAKYIRFTIRIDSSGVDINSVMLNEGSTALPYEPYGKVWYVEKQIGKVILDGSEGWGLASTYTNNTRFSSSSLILGKTTNLMSNYFVEGQGGTDTPNIDTNGTTGQLMITIPTSIASTLSQFTTWLSTNNTEVIYQLATPTYTEITNTTLINQLEALYTAKSQEGTTNISITSEDLEMILNVSALKGDVE